MKNTTNFFAGWFFLRLLFTGLIIVILIDFKNLGNDKSIAGLLYLGAFLIFFGFKFIRKNDFNVVQKIMRYELFLLGIFSLSSRLDILLVCTLFAVAEYFHFQNQFCVMYPSEKWDGNDITEEFED